MNIQVRTRKCLLSVIMTLIAALGAGCSATGAGADMAAVSDTAQGGTNVPAAPTGTAAPSSEKKEVIVFAAASLTEALTEIKDVYEKENPGIALVYSFDSSGTLKTQIEEGAPCDIFLSASPKQMNQLDLEAGDIENPDGLDFVDSATRIDLLENRVVLAARPEAENVPQNFDELSERLKEKTILLAIGNEDVPVGQYTQKIFAYYGLDEETLAAGGCITYGSNVKEVTTQIGEGSVDCGVVYETDAKSAGLAAVDSATSEMCGQVIYPAAVLKTTSGKAEAEAFLNYLTGETASEIFQKIGFTPVS